MRGPFERLAQLGVGRVGSRETQVGADRVVEEVRVLRHETDRGVHRLEREVAHVVAVDAHRALHRVVRRAARASRSWSCPRPTRRRARRCRPARSTSDTSRRVQSLGSSAPGVPGASSDSSETSRPGGWRNHTWSSSMRPSGSTRSTAPGRSVIAAGKSMTSNTRSNETSAVSTSTREFVSCASGW